MKNKTINSILWSRHGKTNFMFASAGLLIGLFMILLALHLYLNVLLPVNMQLNSEQNSEYLIINKQVNVTNTLGLFKTQFSEREIEDLHSKSFIESVGLFSSNQFKASVSIGGVGGSELPVESIDNSFLDTIPESWSWQEGSQNVPIIISNEFINLYNFVMAPSWGTPQIPKGAINKFPIDLYVSGNGRSDLFHANVLGFSDRIVSVLVPQNFMQWANAEYGNGKNILPNRIILKVKNPSDNLLISYLEKNGFETNKDKLKSSAKTIVSILIFVITFFGALIFILSVFLFITTYHLLIAEQKEQIALLFLNGYDVNEIRNNWSKNYLIRILILSVISISVLFLINIFIVSLAEKQGLEIKNKIHLIVYVAALFLFIIIAGYNHLRITNSLKRIYQ